LLLDVVNYKKTMFTGASLEPDYIDKLRDVMELPRPIMKARQVISDLLDARPLLRSGSLESGCTKIYHYAQAWMERNKDQNRKFCPQTDMQQFIQRRAILPQAHPLPLAAPEWNPIPMDDHPSQHASGRQSAAAEDPLEARIEEIVMRAMQRIQQGYSQQQDEQ
jgi:hypothetical protein